MQLLLHDRQDYPLEMTGVGSNKLLVWICIELDVMPSDYGLRKHTYANKQVHTYIGINIRRVS